MNSGSQTGDDERAQARSWELLSLYPELEPGPGFLRGVYRKLAPSIIRFAAPFLGAAAALLVAILLMTDRASDEERELVDNLELLENYELLKTLELVRDAGSPLMEEKK